MLDGKNPDFEQISVTMIGFSMHFQVCLPQLPLKGLLDWSLTIPG
jgi:hypothetical protein